MTAKSRLLGERGKNLDHWWRNEPPKRYICSTVKRLKAVYKLVDLMAECFLFPVFIFSPGSWPLTLSFIYYLYVILKYKDLFMWTFLLCLGSSASSFNDLTASSGGQGIYLSILSW
jgi:hypothetical protein